ncbi:acyclic terpene utilization AtuA family protein [Butyrivibrio sp. WCE2006]|uniref:acyclic terpene utilization AtuA family protein n=1 Tax=Butyrivibrio sp. WCE2006 TaxID=1410611 RepID=UPI0005D2D09C|nr:acyclic terpene utilization AtuA family protein [Butyrivibrio sp. WCE2006]
MKKIAIGGGQGFWGDSPDAAIHMIRKADIQYLACDYLAELTLSIMARQKIKDPSKGFAPDFVTRLLKEVGREAFEKKIRLITNAGGMNVQGCVDSIKSWAEGEKLSGYKIGYVTGDDIKEKIPKLISDGWEFPSMDTAGSDDTNGVSFEKIKDKIYNCNAYIGHEQIQKCIADGADTVITGRAADSALFLAPFAHEFGWADDDWDNLARGIMAGHLLECGGQGAGGNFMYDWRSVPDMVHLGFPIAELTEDSFEITKAPDCGGLITEQSVKEQFLYEVLDPSNYYTPDVNVDLSHATITQKGENRVSVAGIRGKKRPDTIKLCVGYHKGWKTVSMLSFAWPDAYEKAQYCSEVIMKKMKERGMKADDVHISFIGLDALHLGVADKSPETIARLNECVMRIAVFSEDKNECAKIIPEISPMQLNGPQGASFFGGRAHVQEVMALYPTVIPREALKVESHILTV